MTRAAYPSPIVAGAAPGSFDLVRLWIGGDESALARWLEGDFDRFGVVGVLAQKDRTIADQIHELKRRILQVETLRDALLAAIRASRGGKAPPMPVPQPSRSSKSTERRGGAPNQVPNATEVMTLFGAILAFTVAYAVQAAWDIVSLAVLPL